MFYNIFSKVPKELNEEYIKSFDYWLATLPVIAQKNITATSISGQLGGTILQAECMLEFLEKNSIVSKHYLVKCPKCGEILDVLDNEKEVANVLLAQVPCEECGEDEIITPQNIYNAYKVEKRPDASDKEIEDAIQKELNNKYKKSNFSEADSLIKKDLLQNCFYNPDESAYEKLQGMRKNLDKDYGKNKTAKGASLEDLVLEIFANIHFISGTKKVRTETNQFDCTLLSDLDTQYPSIFNYLAPYFIIECKNEKKTPGITYMNKLIEILEDGDAKFGILFSRKKATNACRKKARDHFLTKTYAPKKEVVICMDDRDLTYILDKKVNLLKYLNFKIFQVVNNSYNTEWEDFKNK